MTHVLALSLGLMLQGQDRVVARDSTARMERLADGVFAIIHNRATENWPQGNTGVVVGSDGVLIIDSSYLPSRAEADIALVRQMTSKPVRFLVNTHWHGDHTHGNGVYRDSFPGLVIIGQRENRYWIALNLEKLPRGSLAPESATRATLARLEARLAAGEDTTGRRYSDAERGALERNVRERRHELDQLARVTVAPPNLLFDDALSLDLGNGRMVEIRNQGRANSPNDLSIYLPAERVLFAGDILVHPLPYVGGSYPGPWIDVLRRLEALPVTALVPGHGPVMADHSHTRRVREAFETARSRIETLYRAGRNLTQAQQEVDLADLRPLFRNREGDLYSADAFRGWANDLVARMVQCVHGYQC